jgi:hypothetical protein
MNLPEEFLRHAADCKQMAKFTRDPVSAATWNEMAERWLQCAEFAKRQTLLAQPPRKWTRRLVRNWPASERIEI